MSKEIQKIKEKNMGKIAKYRKKLYKKPVLKDLFLEVTLRCNAKCEHCGSNCGFEQPRDEISAEKLKGALKNIADNYKAKDIILNVTGGEPLMRQDLFDIMEYANELGFHWGMTSNGMLINDEILKKMNETNMETISISIDGLKDTHESFRKVPGSFDNIVKNIQDLQNLPSIKIVQVTTVANKKNLHELEDIYNLMKTIGITSWRVLNVDPIGRAKDNKELLLDKDEYKYLFNFIKKKRNENIMNVEYGCSHYLGINLEKELRYTYFTCLTGITVASILSNGDISICPNVERRPEFVQGNIKYDEFSYVWENKYKLFRNDTRTICKECEKCKNWRFCLGDSFHTWNFEKNIPNFCIKNIIEGGD